MLQVELNPRQGVFEMCPDDSCLVRLTASEGHAVARRNGSWLALKLFPSCLKQNTGRIKNIVNGKNLSYIEISSYFDDHLKAEDLPKLWRTSECVCKRLVSTVRLFRAEIVYTNTRKKRNF